MKAECLKEAISEAQRFIVIAKKVKVEKTSYGYLVQDYCKETAACKRASMDLTRALSKMRNFSL